MVQELGVPIGVSLTPESYAYLISKILSIEAYPPQGRSLLWQHPIREETVFSSARYKSDDFRFCARVDFVPGNSTYDVAVCVYAEARYHQQIINEIATTISIILRKFHDLL